MKRVWSMLALLCVSASAMADGASSTTDLSINYLGQLFGDVPGALSGTGSGIVGGLFHVFNEGVMSVAAIWLVYTITQVLLVTATSEGPQKSIKNWMLWTRIVLGFGMLVPGPSGYCLAQELMMQVVIQGVNLADKTWDYALNYMKDGGRIFTLPNGKFGLSNIDQLNAYIGSQMPLPTRQEPNPAIPQSIKSSVGYTLFNQQVCMYLSNYYNQNHKATDQIAKTGSKVRYHMISVPPRFSVNKQLIPGTGVVYFPGYGNQSVDVPARGTPPDNCGSMSINQQSMPAGSGEAQYNQVYAAIVQAALDLSPLAKSTAENQEQASYSGDGNIAGAHYLAQSVMDYVRLIQPVANFNAKNATTGDADFIEEAKSQGWFNAGAFYWNMMHLNNVLGQSSGGNWQGLAPNLSGTYSDSFPEQLMNQVSRASQGMVQQGIWNLARDNISAQLSGGTSGVAIHHRDITGKSTMGIDFGVITGPLDGMIGKVNSLMEQDSGMYEYNPILVSFAVGKYALSCAGFIWLAFIAVLTPLSVGLGICDSTSPGNVIFKGIVSWLSPIVTMSCGFLFATGVMLTFYAPIYPYLIFLFSVIGWLLCVVESMVAAPLVAFGMTHPEGHDFMGRAEQALMLVLSTFLRPTLLVIGYVVGILLSYIASGFLNMVLGQVFGSIYNHKWQPMATAGDGIDGAWSIVGGSPSGWAGHFTDNPISDCLLVPVVFMLYSMIMLEVVNQCFSAIHQVPDMVMRWIGGPQQQSDAATRAQSIKSAVDSAGQQMAKVGNGLSENAGKMHDQIWGKTLPSSSGDPDGKGAPKGTGEGSPEAGGGAEAAMAAPA